MAEQLLKLYTPELQKNLFPTNTFTAQSKVDGGIEPNAKTVEIPQAGGLPTILENPASFPLTVGTRTDDVKTYSVDLVATEPIHIEDVNELVISYDKRQDVIKDHAMALNTRIADKLAYAWANTPGSANISRTTGAAATAAPGLTGTRKAITFEDFVAIAEKFDRDDIPEEQRFALLPATMYYQMLADDKILNSDYYNSKPVVDGVVAEVMGIKIFKRSRAAAYDATAAAKIAAGTVASGTENEAALFWSSSMVRRAEGKLDMYLNEKQAEYLGSIMNASLRVGGTQSRTDEKGVYTLVQEA